MIFDVIAIPDRHTFLLVGWFIFLLPNIHSLFFDNSPSFFVFRKEILRSLVHTVFVGLNFPHFAPTAVM